MGRPSPDIRLRETDGTAVVPAVGGMEPLPQAVRLMSTPCSINPPQTSCLLAQNKERRLWLWMAFFGFGWLMLMLDIR